MDTLISVQMSLSQKSLNLIDKITELLRPVGQVIPYGSQISGTATTDSDIDFALIVTDPSEVATRDIINRTVGILKKAKVTIVSVWDKAKAPLVRAAYQEQTFDIIFNGGGGVVGTWLIQDLIRDNPIATKVIKTIKEWAKVNDVLGASQGRLGSHALTVFTLHYLMTVGIVGLAHLNNDAPGWAAAGELNQSASRRAYCHGPREDMWWISKRRRTNRRFYPSYKHLVRGVLFRLDLALNTTSPQDRQIYSVTMRARIPVTEGKNVSNPPLLYIEDPISKQNTASNLKPVPFNTLRTEVAKALAYLRRKGTCTHHITEKAGTW